MSDQFLYKCNCCNFTIYTDENGCECTSYAISYLHLCKKCKSLFKLSQSVTDLFSGKNKDEIIKIWYDPEDDFCGQVVTDTCPLCHNIGSITKWEPHYGCPKCGGTIELDNSAPSIHTD